MKGLDDERLVALTGSQNRARTLAVLSAARRPLTAYRIAKISGGQKIKVGSELRSLAEAGIVKKSENSQGRSVWALDDEDLRGYLQTRIRVVFTDDWERLATRPGKTVGTLLREIERALPDPAQEPNFYRPRNWRPSPDVKRTIRELVRDPAKDQILRKYGARTSRNEGRRL